ncbi:hypothetical protein KOPIIPEJ_02316 [Aeromonas dhakensis]
MIYGRTIWMSLVLSIWKAGCQLRTLPSTGLQWRINLTEMRVGKSPQSLSIKTLCLCQVNNINTETLKRRLNVRQ